jgi:acyl-CoA thioester hydrolase
MPSTLSSSRRYGSPTGAPSLTSWALKSSRLATSPAPGYVIAETTVRYKAPIFLDHPLYGAATIPTIGNRTYAMDFELRTGESFESGLVVAEGYAAHVFFDPKTNEVKYRPDWFLPAVTDLEGRPEISFAPESG